MFTPVATGVDNKALIDSLNARLDECHINSGGRRMIPVPLRRDIAQFAINMDKPVFAVSKVINVSAMTLTRWIKDFKGGYYEFENTLSVSHAPKVTSVRGLVEVSQDIANTKAQIEALNAQLARLNDSLEVYKQELFDLI